MYIEQWTSTYSSTSFDRYRHFAALTLSLNFCFGEYLQHILDIIYFHPYILQYEFLTDKNLKKKKNNHKTVLIPYINNFLSNTQKELDLKHSSTTHQLCALIKLLAVSELLAPYQ